MRLRQGIVIQQQQQKYCETKMQLKKLVRRYGVVVQGSILMSLTMCQMCC